MVNQRLEWKNIFPLNLVLFRNFFNAKENFPWIKLNVHTCLKKVEYVELSLHPNVHCDEDAKRVIHKTSELQQIKFNNFDILLKQGIRAAVLSISILNFITNSSTKTYQGGWTYFEDRISWKRVPFKSR